VTEMLELCRRGDIVAEYSSQLPGMPPVDILPLSHVCNFDQSPQSVKLIATTTPEGAVAQSTSGPLVSDQLREWTRAVGVQDIY
jgi:hypothetical protein